MLLGRSAGMQEHAMVIRYFCIWHRPAVFDNNASNFKANMTQCWHMYLTPHDNLQHLRKWCFTDDHNPCVWASSRGTNQLGVSLWLNRVQLRARPLLNCIGKVISPASIGLQWTSDDSTWWDTSSHCTSLLWCATCDVASWCSAFYSAQSYQIAYNTSMLQKIFTRIDAHRNVPYVTYHIMSHDRNFEPSAAYWLGMRN